MLTNLHCFLTNKEASNTATDTDSSSESDNNTDSGGEFNGIEINKENDSQYDIGTNLLRDPEGTVNSHHSSESDQKEVHWFEELPPERLAASWVYQDWSTTSSELPILPRLIGRLDPPEIGGHHSMPSRSVSGAYDYALVPLQDPMLAQPNVVLLPGGKTVEIVHVNRNDTLLPGHAILAAGVSGVREVEISGTLSSLTFPWSQKENAVLTIATFVGKMR